MRAAPMRTAMVLIGIFAGSSLIGCGPPPVRAEPVATGLDFPAAFTMDPDNATIWYGERFSGEIRRKNLSTGEDKLVWRITGIQTQNHQGLLGLALHPNYPSTRLLYAFATRDTGSGDRNQILRIPLSDAHVGISQQVILNDTVQGDTNVGGRILFGPDGKLWGHVGDHSDPATAQQASNFSGKVVRLNADGTVPADNPFNGSKTWAYGFRNSFGFDFDPETGRPWLIDNGPECNDEVDIVVRGANHGWGATGYCGPPGAPTNTNQDGPQPRILPVHLYESPSIGPTAGTFCDNCGLAGTDGALLMGTANDGLIRRLTLDSGRADVTADEVLFDHSSAVLSIENRPGEPVYFSDPTAIYRLVPAS
jgi:glucose/arabinose dehydrogenase